MLKLRLCLYIAIRYVFPSFPSTLIIAYLFIKSIRNRNILRITDLCLAPAGLSMGTLWNLVATNSGLMTMELPCFATSSVAPWGAMFILIIVALNQILVMHPRLIISKRASSLAQTDLKTGYPIVCIGVA